MTDPSNEQRANADDLYRENSPPVASIRVARETELARGWEFEVRVGQPDRLIRVRLSFADYEYWSHGTAAPCRVVQLLVNELAAQGSPLLGRDDFDAARARRQHPDIDARLLERL